jgi:hypothetical protein
MTWKERQTSGERRTATTNERRAEIGLRRPFYERAVFLEWANLFEVVISDPCLQ